MEAYDVRERVKSENGGDRWSGMIKGSGSGFYTYRFLDANYFHGERKERMIPDDDKKSDAPESLR